MQIDFNINEFGCVTYADVLCWIEQKFSDLLNAGSVNIKISDGTITKICWIVGTSKNFYHFIYDIKNNSIRILMPNMATAAYNPCIFCNHNNCKKDPEYVCKYMVERDDGIIELKQQIIQNFK